MKICVYAIASNEEKFAERWAESVVPEADGVYVLNTGSFDKTSEILKEHGVHVTEREPINREWRFDEARNESLALVPEDADFVLCIDLDEVISKGWRKELEEALLKSDGATRVHYTYVWDHFPNGDPARVFTFDKIHARHGYRWKRPVHEILEKTSEGDEVVALVRRIRIDHWPDSSKGRGGYLPLLKTAVAEDPDPQLHYYLCREYCFHEEWDNCISACEAFLSRRIGWYAERASARRYEGLAYLGRGDVQSAINCFESGYREDASHRECLMELMRLYTKRREWDKVIEVSGRLFDSGSPTDDYITELVCWREEPLLLYADALWNVGRTSEASEVYAFAHGAFGARSSRTWDRFNCRCPRSNDWHLNYGRASHVFGDLASRVVL